MDFKNRNHKNITGLLPQLSLPTKELLSEESSFESDCETPSA
jgi:hypothetical protein